MPQKLNDRQVIAIFTLICVISLLAATVWYVIVPAKGATNTNEQLIEDLKRQSEAALATADSLQAIIDIRELQIKTIYETLDHIPDYVRGMSAAERDSLRAIINPPN